MQYLLRQTLLQYIEKVTLTKKLLYQSWKQMPVNWFLILPPCVLYLNKTDTGYRFTSDRALSFSINCCNIKSATKAVLDSRILGEVEDINTLE